MSDVSVVIPTWNRSALLRCAVESALRQTAPPLEVLVADDGSTDDSQAVVSSIGDPRVRWAGGERGGRPAIPRNRGIRESRGEWIAFLDNDDEWFPEKLELQLDRLEKSGCRAACANAVRHIPGQGDNGRLLTGGAVRVSFRSLLDVNRVICSSAVVHRSLLEQAGGFPEQPELKALEDYALWLRVAVFTDIVYLEEPLLRYRDDAAASLRRDDVDVWEQRRRVFADFLAWGARTGIKPAYLRQVRLRMMRDRIERLMKRMAEPLKRAKRTLLS